MKVILREKIRHLGELGEIVQVHMDQEVLDNKENLDFTKVDPFVFNVGEYWNLNEKIGTYGYSKQTKWL